MIDTTKEIPKTDTRSNAKETEEQIRPGKMDEAFELLNKAVKEKEEEINRLIIEKYVDIKNKMSEAIGNNRLTEVMLQNLSGAIHKGEDRLKEMTVGIDKKFQKNPWLCLGVAAAGCFLWGYITRESKYSKRS